MHDSILKNWIPYKLFEDNGQRMCEWLNTFEAPFSEPFFDDTLLKCRRLNKARTSLTSVSDLAVFSDWASNANAIAPTAFIFHVSRCGSTLVSQLLATSANNIVLSEVPFFDSLLRLPYQDNNFDSFKASALFADAVKFYGQSRTGHEQRLFIKTDCWHIFFHKQIRRLYPGVPFILMYRSPDEVFSSHKKSPGMQAVPGLIEPEIFGIDPAAITYHDLDAHLSAVLEKILGKYIELIETDNLSLLINYNEGPIPIIQKIASFINMDINPQTLPLMRERSRYHSKKPGETFSEKISIHIPPSLEHAMALYHQLEKKRIET
jgi:hypothetical protein